MLTTLLVDGPATTATLEDAHTADAMALVVNRKVAAGKVIGGRSKGFEEARTDEGGRRAWTT